MHLLFPVSFHPTWDSEFVYLSKYLLKLSVAPFTSHPYKLQNLQVAIYGCFLSCWLLFSPHALNHVQAICMSRATFMVSELWCWRCCPVSEHWTPTVPMDSRASLTGRSPTWLTGESLPALWTLSSRASTTPNNPTRRRSWRWIALPVSPGAGRRWRRSSRRSSRSRH